MTSTTHETAARLDAEDPLASYRDRFVGSETPLVYLDGNSLGRPLRTTGERLRSFVDQEWGGRLIRGWDEAWMDLPTVVGDRIGSACLGAAPGQVVVGDSTTVLLYKALRAGVAARPGRTEVVLDRDNFPTDRYVAAGVADELGLTLRWIDVDTSAGVTLEQVQEVVGEETAVVLLSHVAYRSAWLADAPAITAAVHDAGALVLWDLSHSVGSVPLELDAWGVDLAVGCTYKYLNGGPGSPAFVYVAERLLDGLRQPIPGWMGHADPFAMGPGWTPAPGIRRMISGTPPVVGMLALQDMLALVEEVGMEAVRAKSVGLTEHALALTEDLLAPLGVGLATPREARRRGGHVTLTHPAMREVTARLWEVDVIPDYRDPGGLRLGLSPLSTSYDEVARGLARVRDVLLDLGASGA
ncbi:kynureninase [Nocardioides marinisabuli]|uniref:Kynureninase n=1 Tax=Nocardioides marinisabuli TaxID=419476 RepID=A0A7Y9F2B8_9ACTN|nr:aminotransferase class V-fold PLP-dependent enzyme [Nocardioides marinisabuli]NYD58234.1 kynureninase [Nocardioides marinisabuli]